MGGDCGEGLAGGAPRRRVRLAGARAAAAGVGLERRAVLGATLERGRADAGSPPGAGCLRARGRDARPASHRLPVRPASALARAARGPGPDRPPRGAVRARDGRGAAAARSAALRGPVRALLRAEHREAVSAAVPLVRGVCAAPRRGRLRGQHGGGGDPAAQGAGRPGRAHPARRRPRRLPARRAIRAQDAARRRVRRPAGGAQGRGHAPARRGRAAGMAAARQRGRRRALRPRGPRPRTGPGRAGGVPGVRERIRAVRAVPGPRRPGRPVAADAELAGAVRPRRGRSDGVGCSRRREPYRRASRRRRGCRRARRAR